MRADQRMMFKDTILDQLAAKHNVAQFVSFDPQLKQRFSRVESFPANHVFPSHAEALEKLLRAAPDNAVNIRTFRPENPLGSVFDVGLRSLRDARDRLEERARQGLYVIANEMIDVRDGGVSGVSMSGLTEFAPGDTPRCVEREEVAALSTELAWSVFASIYGIRTANPFRDSERMEFSIHPYRRGFKGEQVVFWQVGSSDVTILKTQIRWPNVFSRFVGDKVFGLLLAHCGGFCVPKTHVLCRNLPPFTFGRPTGAPIPWVRTSPAINTPGKFTTQRGWLDPFRLLAQEDPDIAAPKISSVVIQDEVHAAYSGAAMPSIDGSPTIEGVLGFGDKFMLGEATPLKRLPMEVIHAVSGAHKDVMDRFGPVRMEWVWDNATVWILQLKRESEVAPAGEVIVEGDATHFYDFDVSSGLEALRSLVEVAKSRREGINLVGDVGLTSHMAEVLRDARVPSRRVSTQKSFFETS